MPRPPDIGGFDHNAHALRLVTRLEHRYADFDGLNLTWEDARRPGQATTALWPSLSGHRIRTPPAVPGPIAGPSMRAGPCWMWAAGPASRAQVAALADDIAYVNHDIDDGLQCGHVRRSRTLAEAPLAGAHALAVLPPAMANWSWAASSAK